MDNFDDTMEGILSQFKWGWDEKINFNNHYDMEEQCVDNSMVISYMFVMYPNTKDYFVISMIQRIF